MLEKPSYSVVQLPFLLGAAKTVCMYPGSVLAAWKRHSSCHSLGFICCLFLGFLDSRHQGIHCLVLDVQVFQGQCAFPVHDATSHFL